ncbi:hypothetical protein, partial [Rhizobium sp. Root483D2]|uniref:hypothetical protein n=1 Tax=Rhizobium sp. Root483D2 TaxID=1736545 RepID=UPI00138F50C7
VYRRHTRNKSTHQNKENKISCKSLILIGYFKQNLKTTQIQSAITKFTRQNLSQMVKIGERMDSTIIGLPRMVKHPDEILRLQHSQSPALLLRHRIVMRLALTDRGLGLGWRLRIWGVI